MSETGTGTAIDLDDVPTEVRQVEIKMFLRHEPSGYVVHVTLTGDETSFGGIQNLIDWFVARDFVDGWGSGSPRPAAVTTTAPAVPPADPAPGGRGGTPPCPDCGASSDYREGVGQDTGKAYRGFFCTVNRDHKPQWLPVDRKSS